MVTQLSLLAASPAPPAAKKRLSPEPGPGDKTQSFGALWGRPAALAAGRRAGREAAALIPGLSAGLQQVPHLETGPPGEGEDVRQEDGGQSQGGGREETTAQGKREAAAIALLASASSSSSRLPWTQPFFSFTEHTTPSDHLAAVRARPTHQTVPAASLGSATAAPQGALAPHCRCTQ